MNAVKMSNSTCYNHDDIRAVFRCFDCKQDVVVRFCKECHEQVHSLPVFRLHKTQPINKVEQRKLSQDVSDLETLVSVENDLLKDVLTTLQYTEQQEREMLKDVIVKTEKRLHDIQQCHEKVDKAIHYLNKVSSVIKLCSDNDTSLLQEVSSNKQEDKSVSEQKPSEGEAQGTSSLIEEFPVAITSSLKKNGGFWMVRTDSAGLKKVAQIENGLREHFTVNSLSLYSTPIKEGTVCVASNATKTEYWRVRIEKLCKDQLVTVHYLDHGQQENIPLECIFDIPPAIKQIPHQAMECSLFPYSENISLPYEAKWCFKDLTHGKDLKAKICSKVIFPSGNALFHVQLSSIGPLPTNINQKVTDLLLQQQLNQQDRPILPKEDYKNQPQAVEECKTTTSKPDDSVKPVKQAGVSIATKEPIEQNGAQKELEAAGLLESSQETPEQSIVSQAPVVSTKEEFQKPSTLTILTKSNAEKLLFSDVPKNSTHDSKDTKETASETKPLMSVPEYVPIGFLNEFMYDKIFKECKANFLHIKPLIVHARFFLIQVDELQLAEAMKTKIWCCIDEILSKNINRAYRDQTSRSSKHAVFLVFLSKFYIVGLVRVISQCQTTPHCTVVGRGLLWNHCCHGEFCIELFNANKLSLKAFESDFFLRQILKENIVGKEIKWEKGADIIHKYERMKRKTSVLDDACKMYRKELRKEFVSSQENLSEDEERPTKGLHKVQDLETKLTVASTSKTRRRSSEDDGEILKDKKLDLTKSDEDWEPDLEREPAKVADIYSSISSPAASIDSTGETGAMGILKDESILIAPSESEVITKCAVDDSSLRSVGTGIANELDASKDEKPAQTDSSPGGSRDVSVDEKEKTCNTEETLEKKTSEKTEDSEKSFVAENLETQMHEDQTCKLEVSKAEDRNGSQAEVDLEVADNNEGVKDVKFIESCGKQTEMVVEVVASRSDEEISEPGKGDSELVTVEETKDAQLETIESSKVPIVLDNLTEKAVTEDGVKSEFSEQKENLAEENKMTLTGNSKRDGEENSTRKTTFPVSQERCPSYFPHVAPTLESQPEQREFYVVNPPKESHQTDPGVLVESESDGKCKITKELPSGESVNASQEDTVTTPESGGASGDVSEEDIIWEKETSPVNIDNEPSIKSVSDQLSYAPRGDAAAAASDWLTGSADVMYDKESVDDEEVIGFLPVEPGCGYRVIMMSEPNEDKMFWARIYRNVEEEKAFKRFSKRLNIAVERRNEKLSNVFVMKNCCMRLKNIAGTYRRVLIKKLLGKGKVLVQNVDLGYTSELHVDDLRELDSEFQIAFPPQAFECRILNEISMKDKMKFSRISAGRPNSRRGLNIELEIYVKAISGEIAEVDVLRVLSQTSNY